MFTEERVLALIDLIYSAACDPDQWMVVLDRISDALDSTTAIIHYQDMGSMETCGLAAMSSDFDRSRFDEYANYYAFHNPWISTRPEILREGGVYPGQVLCPNEIFRRSEFYNDFLMRTGIAEGLGVTVLKGGTVCSQLSVFRADVGDYFDEPECKLVRTLMPHLQRAFQLHGRMQQLERKAQTAADALDRLPTGVVLLDALSRVLLVNRAARETFAKERGLMLTTTGLFAVIPVENRRLSTLLQGAIDTGRGNGLESGGMMTISRENSPHPLQVFVTPLRTKTISFGKDVPVTAIFISNPDRKPLLETQLFSHLYKLTPSEARLAQVLVSGGTLKEAAERFGVAQSTVRSQLKSIFSKTGTNRQTELIRVLLASLIVSSPRA